MNTQLLPSSTSTITKTQTPERELLLEVIKTSVSCAQVLYHEHLHPVVSGHLVLKSSKYTASNLSLQFQSQKCLCVPPDLHISYTFGFLN